MKTFQEAFRTVVAVESTADMTPEREKEIVDRLFTERQRFQALSSEIDSDQFVEMMVEGTVNASCCQKHACLNAFKIGLRIGMEMERSETGGVQL